jgi:metal-sulfur cluster biosynthetic enzyme
MRSIDEETILLELDSIIDPCSEAAGAPAGIFTMGLVRSLQIVPGESGAAIHLTIGVTEPGCLMGSAFAEGARVRLEKLPGVGAIKIDLDERLDWHPSDMLGAYREKLERIRAERRIGMPVAIRKHGHSNLTTR